MLNATYVLSFLIVKNLLMGIIMKHEQLSKLIKIIHFKSFLKLKKKEVGVEVKSWEKPICPCKRHDIINSILFNCTVSPEFNAVDTKLLAGNRCK